MDITYSGLSVRAWDVQFWIDADGAKVGIMLSMPGHTTQNHKVMTGIILLMPDQARGVFDIGTKVGSVEVVSPDAARGTKRPLKEFPRAFDEFISRAEDK